MDEAPEVPQPVPTIPRGPLWVACSIPPLATLLGNLIVSVVRNPDPYGTTFLWVPIVIFFIILFCTPAFNRAVGKRYRGRSLVFLNWAYILGQMIVCLALWLGSCLLYLSTP